MKTREQLIQDLLSHLKADKNVIVLNWATGVGKSNAAISMANYLIDEKKKRTKEPFRILLIVAEISHKNNWKKEFEKWHINTDCITIECYASLKKYVNTSWDLIIYDEAHHLQSEARTNIMCSIKSNNVFALSATLPEAVLRCIFLAYGKPEVSYVTLKDAIRWGILPEPKIYLVPLELDNTKETEVFIEEWGKAELRKEISCSYYQRWKYIGDKKQYPNVTLKVSCTEKQKYTWYTDKFNYWKRVYMHNRQEFMKNKWLRTGSERKVYLGSLKTQKVKQLIDKIHNKRFVCFCTNIEQCETLGGENSVHSEKANSLQIIEDFKNKKINSLFAVNMIQEGQNLDGIEMGIIVQLDNAERAFLQKFGRSLRSDSPVQFIFYYKETRDSEFLENVFDSVNKEYIAVIDDINDFNL